MGLTLTSSLAMHSYLDVTYRRRSSPLPPQPPPAGRPPQENPGQPPQKNRLEIAIGLHRRQNHDHKRRHGHGQDLLSDHEHDPRRDGGNLKLPPPPLQTQRRQRFLNAISRQPPKPARSNSREKIGFCTDRTRRPTAFMKSY